MKISLRWLQEFVDLSDLAPEKVGELLSLHVAEVEGMEQVGASIADVVVGEVVECGRHPDADKLSVTMVASGDGEPVPVVCGAPNVRQGLKVAFAPVGAVLPGDFKIKKAKLRGQASCGMICSARELELSDEHEGIIELDADAPVGASLVEHLDLADTVFEVDNKSLTHRPDLWGHHGFARELATILDRPLKGLGEEQSWPMEASAWSIVREDEEGCPAYAALEIDPGGPPSESPAWIQQRLRALDQRPVNLLVDLSNLVMLETGQPTHTFDAATLAGDTIRVRPAAAGEVLRTLDGHDRELRPTDMVIADDEKAIALAGVMGGEATEVGEATTRILLESAVFHPTRVRRTAQRLALRSEASARFEKALDPGLAVTALHRFVELLLQARPEAKVLAAPSLDGDFQAPERSLPFAPAAAAARLGIPASAAEQERILGGLGFDIEADGETWTVRVPSWRATKDVTAPVDLVEEVGRILGYHRIEPAPLTAPIQAPVQEPHRLLSRRLLLRTVQAHGAAETQGYSFLARPWAARLGLSEGDFVRIGNPVQAEVDLMRRDPLPSLLEQMQANLQESGEGLLVEAAKGYEPGADGPRERRWLGLVLWGPRDLPAEGVSSLFGRLRSLTEDLLRTADLRGLTAMPLAEAGESPAWAHPVQGLAWQRGEERLAVMARLHPSLAQELDLERHQAACLLLDLDRAAASERPAVAFQAPSRFPGIKVDVALSLPEAVACREADAALRKAGGKLLESLELFDLYRGEGLEPGHRSLAFRAVLRAADRTLSDKEEAKFLAKAARAAEDLGGQVRG